MAVDGPKGPIYQVKSGVFELSRLLRAPIFPVGVYSQKFFRFEKSWNKTFLPHPFSKVVIVFSAPIEPISKTMDPRSPELAAKLSGALGDAKQQASKFIAGHRP